MSFGSGKRRFDLVCFDVDGTLVDDTIFIWQTIHQALGSDEQECRRVSDDFHQGRITYAQWAQHDIDQWVKRDAGRDDLLHALRGIRAMQGAEETLAALRQAGCKLGIVSGTLDLSLELTLPHWRSLFDRVYLNILQFDGRDKVCGVQPTPYDMSMKGQGVLSIGREFDIEPARIAFVGDHYNDVSAARAAGFTIAFNCKSPELAQLAHALVPGPDLRAILPLLLDL